MKVIIDSFDTEEQGVAFIHWLSKQSYADNIKLLTTQGLMSVQYDGVDTSSSSSDKLVVNIVVDSYIEEDDCV